MNVRTMSAQRPDIFGLFAQFLNQKINETGPNSVALISPKAKVTRSNRVGRASVDETDNYVSAGAL